MDDDGSLSPGAEDARWALAAIGAARRRSQVPPPAWLHWALAGCMAAAGLADLLRGAAQTIAQLGVLAAVLGLSFATQRSTGIVRRVTRPPRRPLPVWLAFAAVVLAAVLALNAFTRAGFGTYGFFALAVLIAVAGPHANRLWRSVT